MGMVSFSNPVCESYFVTILPAQFFHAPHWNSPNMKDSEWWWENRFLELVTYRAVKIIAEIGRPGACGKNMSLQQMFHWRHNAQSNGPMSVRET